MQSTEGMARKKILFIINPISGGKDKKNFINSAKNELNKELFLPEFSFTKDAKDAEKLTKAALEKGVDVIVAVGGDGTINAVAKEMVGSNSILGVVPKGSGNGLARALNIPIGEKAALSLLNTLNVKHIDVGYINGKPFFNIAGMGFDALISSRFAEKDFRGPLSYMQTVFSEIHQYKPLDYTINIDGITFERKAFMVSIANSPQYGNEAHISPNASLEDGMLDVCIVKPFPLVQLPKMLVQLFSKKADKSEYVEIILGKNIEIIRSINEEIHVDGEPLQLEKDIVIQVNPKALGVICA